MALTIRENEPLARYTTFKIGGPARFFVPTKTEEEIIEAVQFAASQNLPYVFLGGGTNTLVSDEGYRGVVIRNEDRSLSFNGPLCYASAGTILAVMVHAAVQKGLSGMEWAFGVPGTVGGAVRGNAGAFGLSTYDSVYRVRVLHPDSHRVRMLDRDELTWGYRDSIFKHTPLIILAAEFMFTPLEVEQCQTNLELYLTRKKESQPLGKECAGCVFKNPHIQSFPKDVPLPIEFFQKEYVPAGWLVEQVNLKHHVIGGATISGKHGNFFLNANNATAADVVQLITLAKDRVREKFGVTLEEEIVYLGF